MHQNVFLRALGAVLLALLGACQSSPLPQANASVSTFTPVRSWEDVTLAPGDLMRVSVYGHPELSTPWASTPAGTRIGTDGALSLPLIGAVQVGGLDIVRARVLLTDTYARFVKDPKIDVSVVEHVGRRVWLYGEVAKPGAYVLDRPLNVYQALALGGGFTTRAERDEVVLLRGGAQDLEVLVFDGETPSTDAMVALQPDDFVFVRRSGAGRFSDEVLPYLQGIGSALGSAATLLLIEDRLDE